MDSRLSGSSAAQIDSAGPSSVRIGIIGGGPRGLSILERIAVNAKNNPGISIEIFWVDKDSFGSGCHIPDQPNVLLANTVASQLTMFPWSGQEDIVTPISGPDFQTWLQSSGILGRNGLIYSNEYYPRALLGQYLTFVFIHVMASMPASVTARHFQAKATSLSPGDEATWLLETEQGHRQCLDFVFLTTGHGLAQTAPDLAQASSVIEPGSVLYPQLAGISASQRVAIQGLGLTACDVISVLTKGRGGRYVREENGCLSYHPSGNEPQLTAWSRSGLPLRARALNQKGRSGRYIARFLTPALIASLRSRKNKIEFQRDICPLLHREMEYAYYTAWVQSQDWNGPRPSLPLEPSALARFVADHVPDAERFNWNAQVNPIPPSALTDPQSWKAWLTSFLQDDIAQARRGNQDSPIKAATDALRDLRDCLAMAIDHGGLDEASHRKVRDEFMPILSRLAIGPPLQRIEEMLALMAAGILDLDLGPDPLCQPSDSGQGWTLQSRVWPGHKVHADLLIQARIPASGHQKLISDLCEKGTLRLFRNGTFVPGGIDVTPELNVISRDGCILSNFWALGAITEGVRFYTNVLPRPEMSSTFVRDADRAVRSLFHQIVGHSDETGPDLYQIPA